MFWGSMSFAFEVMIYVGIGLPLVNLILAQFGSGADGAAELDTDLSADVSADFAADFSADLELGADFSADVATELDLDAGAGADLGGTDGGMPLRFNIYCLCLSLVTMGAMGVFAMETMEGLQRILTLAGGLVLSILAYVLLYRFLILPLKRNDAAPLRAKDLQFRRAKVSFRILPESPGKIETRDATGAAISYEARMDPDICRAARIDEGEEVLITEVFAREGFCHVTLPQRREFS